MSVTEIKRNGLPWIEALGVATGLTIGFAIAFALVGPATASSPAFMTTLAVVLPMIVVGQRIGAKEFDVAFWMAVALVVLVTGSELLAPLTG